MAVLVLAAGCAESTERRTDDGIDGAVAMDGGTSMDSALPEEGGGGTGRLDSSRPLADSSIPAFDGGRRWDASIFRDGSIRMDGGIIIRRDATIRLDGGFHFPDMGF